MDKLIQLFKFEGKLAAGYALGMLMARRLAISLNERPQLIIPVPLHPRRLKRRGYNQALELGRPIAKHLGIPLQVRSLRRCRPTAPQTKLGTPAQRRRNVRHAFTCDGRLNGVGHVAVRDDVMTTGATVAEVARTLRQSGVV